MTVFWLIAGSRIQRARPVNAVPYWKRAITWDGVEFEAAEENWSGSKAAEVAWLGDCRNLRSI
ncbi:hypothetical protein [Rhizobium terricola]|uniref:hypothetical protein n=1 Tax=Rhizobium terricola TaxID=2728849 RepID=UPI00146AA16B|nr:hypothetical protein [Rhizobium terricola]